MPRPLILASSSPTRLQLLRAAALDVAPESPRIDEDAIRTSLLAGSTTPRDIADALAEAKARKISIKHPAALVLGCDQVLDFDGQTWGKPESPDHAFRQLSALAGRSHKLHSALVLYDHSEPIWRHISTARLTLRDTSPEWLTAYIARNWEEIRHSAGGYQIESEGIRLFSAIEGDYFAILGLPMLPLLAYLAQRGFIDT